MSTNCYKQFGEKQDGAEQSQPSTAAMDNCSTENHAAAVASLRKQSTQPRAKGHSVSTAICRIWASRYKYETSERRKECNGIL